MSAHPYLAGADHPRVLAHRGLVTRQAAADGIAENTIAAFALAHAAGAQFVETDARATADGVAVLCHDETLERVLGDPRAVASLTVAELEALYAPHGGLARLPEAIRDFPELRFNIDVKSVAAAAPVGRAAAAFAERVLLTSFSDARRVRAMREAKDAAAGALPAASAGAGTIARFVLLAALHAPLGVMRRTLRGIDALQVPERQGALRIVTPRTVRLAHACGVEVHVWTVNDEAAMRRLLALGVDGIVTDRADVALAVVRG